MVIRHVILISGCVRIGLQKLHGCREHMLAGFVPTERKYYVFLDARDRLDFRQG